MKWYKSHHASKPTRGRMNQSTCQLLSWGTLQDKHEFSFESWGQAWRGGLVKSSEFFQTTLGGSQMTVTQVQGDLTPEASKDTSTGILILLLISLKRKVERKRNSSEGKNSCTPSIKNKIQILSIHVNEVWRHTKSPKLPGFWLTRDPVPMSCRDWPEKTPDIVL